MRALGASRTSLVPGGVLAGPWVRDALWRRARAVPSLDLRFADNKSLTDAVTGASLVTFTRASNGTFVDSAGVLQTASTDVPRFDHNPITGESLGLLVEEQRSNLCLQSEDFSTTWTTGVGGTGVSAVVTANDGQAPNNTATADRIQLDKGAGATLSDFSQVQQGITLPAATGSSFSVYLRSYDSNSYSVAIRITNVNTIQTVLVTPTWQRFVVTSASSPSVSIAVQIILRGTYGTSNTADILVWGAQLEAGAFPTSYIPTTTAAATRSADVASIGSSAFTSFYNQSEGTVFSQSSVSSPAAYTGRVYTFGTATDNISLFRQFDFQPVLRCRVGNSDQALLGLGATWTDTANRRIAQVYKVDDFAGCVNGGSVSTDSSGSLPSVTALSIGSQDTASFFNGHIRRLVFWPQRLPNNILQGITQ